MKPALTLLAATAALALQACAPTKPGGSLTDVRREMNTGTWSGTTLIEAKPQAAPQPAPTPAPAAAPASAAAVTRPAPLPVPVAPTPAPAAKQTPTTTTKPAATSTPAAAAAVTAPAAVPAKPAATEGAARPTTSSEPSSSEQAPADPGTTTSGKGLSLGTLFGWGQPPTGRPMNEAKRLDSPSIGILLPIAGSASAAASGPAQGK